MAKQSYGPDNEALIPSLASNETIKSLMGFDGPLQYMLFSTLKSNRDRYLYALSRVHNLDEIFPEVIHGAQKCSMTSEILKVDGNSAFGLHQFQKAHELYTLSAAYAVHGQKTLALSIGNRSGALFFLGKYKEALVDIENVLQFGYPKELQYKLYDRKGKSYKELKSYKAAESAFRLAVELLEKAALGEEKKKTTLQQIQDNIDICIKNRAANVEVDLSHMKKELPKLADGPNVTHPSLSSACRVEYKPEKGRYIVAARDIKPGEVLLVEKPFASVFKPNEEYKDCCHHCFYPCDTLLPCLKCTRGRYCSTDCRALAWESYHKYECGVPLHDLIWEGTWEYLSIRIVLVAGLNRLLRSQQNRNSAAEEEDICTEFEGCNEERKYLSCDYTPVYYLQPHNVALEQNYAAAFTAVFLIKLLDKMGFFDNIANKEKETAMICVGECLIAHTVSKFLHIYHNVPVVHSTDIAQVASVGGSALATLSLFNHSCDIETSKTTHGNNIVMHAVQSFKQGQEVTYNYGQCFPDIPKSDRKAYLQQELSFTCKCKCCQGNWPLMEDISETPTFKCTQCEEPLPGAKRDFVQCPRCKLVQSLKDKKESLSSASRLYEVARKSDNIPLRLQYIEAIDKLLVQPFRDYVKCKATVGPMISWKNGTFVSRH